jgi:lipoyl(octanoyl) transferase
MILSENRFPPFGIMPVGMRKALKNPASRRSAVPLTNRFWTDKGQPLWQGRNPARPGAPSGSPCYAARVVKERDELKVGLGLPPGSAGVEWRVSDARVPYETAVALMQERAAGIAAGRERELVWLLEHPPLYTSGTSAKPEQLVEARFPVFESGRGGQMTYHGPGQRVAYVMLDLKRRSPDVRRYVATLEEWIIRTLADFNVRGERREDRIGVWVRRPDKGAGFEDKIAAIGIRITHWVTLHGMALNVDPDLIHFAGIVPCGVSDARYGVTSLADLGIAVSMPEVDIVLRREFGALFGAGADYSSTENNSPGRRSLSSSALPSR